MSLPALDVFITWVSTPTRRESTPATTASGVGHIAKLSHEQLTSTPDDIITWASTPDTSGEYPSYINSMWQQLRDTHQRLC